MELLAVCVVELVDHWGDEFLLLALRGRCACWYGVRIEEFAVDGERMCLVKGLFRWRCVERMPNGRLRDLGVCRGMALVDGREGLGRFGCRFLDRFAMATDCYMRTCI